MLFVQILAKMSIRMRTNKQTDRLIDGQTNKQTDKKTDRENPGFQVQISKQIVLVFLFCTSWQLCERHEITCKWAKPIELARIQSSLQQECLFFQTFEIPCIHLMICRLDRCVVSQQNCMHWILELKFRDQDKSNQYEIQGPSHTCRSGLVGLI